MNFTVEKIRTELDLDDKVKVAGFDVDGILRGKIISKKKFLSVLESGFGFCSVIFGWDMHDKTYFKELTVSNAQNGYRDILAQVDLKSYRRIPWEVASGTFSKKNEVPFFLLRFLDPETMEPVAPCPRGFLQKVAEKLDTLEWKAMAGAEYEFYNFSLPTSGSDLPRQPITPDPSNLPHLTPGMFGYSATRPVHNSDWYYKIWDNCQRFRVNLEGWHTESGPGVYEAALEYGDIKEMADRAGLFKYVVKSTSATYGIVPCFMAKPREGLPGNSGHIHLSLIDRNGKNLFSAKSFPREKPSTFPELACLSLLAEHFLAGVLWGLPDIMPMLAPTINSYKRLVENYWAPVTVSWGFEHRSASIRVIGPPTASPGATRFEIRTPGADANPHYALGAILGLGMWGVDEKLGLPVPPLGKGQNSGDIAGERLPKSLKEATERFVSTGSIARKVFGDSFVEHFGGTRQHEIKLWEEAVTDWEIKRYIETV